MSARLMRLEAGHYTDGRYIIEHDSGSVGEFYDRSGLLVDDERPSAPEWFVYDSQTQNMDLVGPPDAVYEAPTLRDVRAWIERQS